MRIKYIDKRFNAESRQIISEANSIIKEYQDEGYSLTLRQIYYQFVARDLIQNKQSEYKRIGGIMNNARLAGLIDWNAIEDRTRHLRERQHWNDPDDIIEAAVNSYNRDKWEGQHIIPEVWIEKDALVGIIEPVCQELDIPYFSCRGYTSQTGMWQAAQRILKRIRDNKQSTIILHFGDHDPSGIDMSRDIFERLKLFTHIDIKFLDRLALTMDQVEEYNPPPNFAKLTDTRCASYIIEYGNKSWELDALEPRVIGNLIRKHVLRIRNEPQYRKIVRRENKEIKHLKNLLRK